MNSDHIALIAGSASGFTVRLLTQPLDVIKIRFQLQIEPISNICRHSYYKGFLQILRRIYAEEGIVGLWRGHVPAQYLSVVFGGIQFQTFESLYTKSNLPKNFVNDFIFGGLSGATAGLFCHPIDVIRTRLSSQGLHKKYTGSLNAIRCISIEEGVYGFFRGLVPSLLLIFPQTAVQFLIYHTMKRFMTSRTSKIDKNANLTSSDTELKTLPLNMYSQLFSGSVAGVISKFSIYPLELAKRRLQVQGFEEARLHFGKLHKSLNMFHCLRKTVIDEGFSGLYKGLLPSSIKAAVVSSLTFFFYEQYKTLLR